MNQAKEILHFFAHLHWILKTGEVRVTDLCPEGKLPVTPKIFSDAWNGRVCINFGPQSRPSFITLRVERDSLCEEPHWEITVDWGCCGPMAIEETEKLAESIDDAIKYARAVEAFIKNCKLPDMHNHQYLLNDLWGRASEISENSADIASKVMVLLEEK